VLQEAHTELANGGPGVAAMIASPDQIIAVAHNSIPETGDLTSHAEMVLLRRRRDGSLVVLPARRLAANTWV
jgi:tRNA(Arg) A34 adenosine deaminase TadA